MNITIRMHNAGGDLNVRHVNMKYVNPADPAEVSEAIKDALREMIDDTVLEPGDTLSIEKMR